MPERRRRSGMVRDGEGTREWQPIAKELAEGVELVILDVDGVLTDGGIYVGALPGGESIELKRFDLQDGVGVKLLQAAGLQVAIVSGRVSRATELRAQELGIEECHQDGGAQKVRVIQDLLDRRGLTWAQVAMLGDDLPDLARQLLCDRSRLGCL
jgi:3-deoxy-D-manno-octulosonate 8-phosphate phosphatase (KDO 8-P phosphatase)